MDLTEAILMLLFSEPINANSVDVPSITLQSAANITSGGTAYTLKGGNVTSMNSLLLRILLDQEDLNIIMRHVDLLRNVSTTYISYPEVFLTDMYGNYITPEDPESAFRATSFIDDVLRPRLLGFSINMTSGGLMLTFNETMDVSSLSFTSISFQLSPTPVDPYYSFQLTGGELLSGIDNAEVYFRLTRFDLNELKVRGIGRSSNMIFIMISNMTITDMVGLYAFPVTSLNTVSPEPFGPDEDIPYLESFQLDLTSEELILIFSEAIEEVDIRNVTLQSVRNIVIIFTLKNTV